MTVPARILTRHAAERGIEERTLRRYVLERLIARPTRGAAAEYPAIAVAQVEELAVARRTTHDLVKLRHWLWWSGLLPDGWAEWRGDRLRGLDGSRLAGEHLAGLNQYQVDRESVALARFWERWRPWPYRRSFLRTRARKEAAAYWTLAAARGDSLPEDLSAPMDSGDKIGQSPTVGQEMDRVFGVARLRELGYPVPGEPGEYARQRLMARPPPTELVTGFALLTEADAVRLRDLAKLLEGQPSKLLARPLRETPELAAGVMVDILVQLADLQVVDQLRRYAAKWRAAHETEPLS